MVTTELELITILDHHGMAYQRIAHPPVFTCEQAEAERGAVQGVSTKNLFLTDRKGKFYLVMTDCQKRLNLKSLSSRLGLTERLIFGSQEDLHAALGLSPGSVTVLALVNDPTHQVELVIDEEIWGSDSYLCHPLVNTVTLVIRHEELERFLRLTGHVPLVVQVQSG